MQITVFGASGKVGSLVVEEALRRGYTVVAFVHNHDLFATSGKLIVKKGNVYSAADVAGALEGSEAVLSCLGSWGTPTRNVLTDATRLVIPAMREQNISRIVTLTGHGAHAPTQKLSLAHKLLFVILSPLPAGKVFRDGEEHMRLLAASDLEWTAFRSPIMTNSGSARYRLSLNVENQLAIISRKAVVAAMLDQLDSTDYLRQAPVIHRA